MPAVPVARATLDWLLDEENPPVRYLTLARLLGRSERAREVRAARARLGDYGPTRKILAARERFWGGGEKLYQKYRGGYWQLVFLGEFLAPREAPGVEEGVEHVLGHQGPRGPVAGLPWWGIHCLNANLLRAMVALGFGDDPRVRAGLEHVAGEIVGAGGVPCFIIDWSLYDTCHMSLPKALLAMTALPPAARSPAIEQAAGICVERLLEREVSKYVSPRTDEWYAHVRSSPDIPSSISTKPEKRLRIVGAKGEFLARRGGLGALKEKAGWRRFGFPLHYNSDTLEAMRALVEAGAPRRTPRVARALDAILERRLPDGRWRLDFSWNGKMIADVEAKGRPSRWITFHALRVLQHFRGLALP
jgi:hypothetical protein